MTNTHNSPATVADRYFDAWQRRDVEAVRPLFHEQVTFVGSPGTTTGADETLAGLSRMFETTTDVHVIKRWVDGPDVLTWFELRTQNAGPIPVVNWSHIEDGRIQRIRVTFDPRPLLG
jgi:ketosteroid isomerase-like protein